MFTTLRIYHQSLDSALTNWKAHCDRLQNSLLTLGWQQPKWSLLRQGAEALIVKFPVLRMTLFPDGREWITGRLLPANLTQWQQQGVTASIMRSPQFQSWLPAHKTGNYLSSWLAKAQAQKMSAHEAILVDEKGNWLETSTGNLWGWRDDCWWTPPIEAGVLPGVVRSQLLSWLSRQYQPAKEEPWSPELVKGFEAIAYTNSVVQFVPIHRVVEGAASEAGEATEAGGEIKYDPYHQAFNQLRELFSV